MATADLISAFRSQRFVTEAVDVSQNLSDSPFTVEWLLSSLHARDAKFNAIAQGSKIEHISAYDISQGKGFVSKVYKVSIKFQHLHEPYQVILKIPGSDSFNDDPSNVDGDELVTEDFVSNAHNTECDFYTRFAPNINIPLAKMYKVIEMNKDSPGALLMESMVDSADSNPLPVGATKEMAYNIATHLATLYKYFLCLPQDQWVGKYTHNSIASFFQKDHLFKYFEKVKEIKPEAFSKAFETFENYLCSTKFYSYVTTTVYKDIVVLTHGDIWTNNLLWKKNSDGSLSNELAVFLDWQIFHEGCLTNDIARFMCICMDGDVRRKHEFKVLKFMYDKIVRLMQEEGKSVDFTFEQMKQGYKANFIGQAAQLMFLASFLFIGKCWTDEEKPIRLTQREKVLLRTQYAMEDAIRYFEDIPKDRVD
ncbi:hypothetical protein L596_017626 [Steinernema carpocapsae]|uniref:CHK kinase-like domain-containing protein n=1 Tax=Steinernema carpocapsae TaxID=34508 RepID=A0A4U5N2H3_STECR|nr:hypothetical protein L596_017626 [Steinernema carpocapsae]